MKKMLHRAVMAALAAATVLALAGCRAVPVHQQRLAARPGMQFSDSPVFAYYAGVLTQIETGAAASGGAQAAGCTSCR